MDVYKFVWIYLLCVGVGVCLYIASAVCRCAFQKHNWFIRKSKMGLPVSQKIFLQHIIHLYKYAARLDITLCFNINYCWPTSYELKLSGGLVNWLGMRARCPEFKSHFWPYSACTGGGVVKYKTIVGPPPISLSFWLDW